MRLCWFALLHASNDSLSRKDCTYLWLTDKPDFLFLLLFFFLRGMAAGVNSSIKMRSDGSIVL
jgi:hypothetical protein